MRERFVDVTTELLESEPSLALVLADIGVALFRESGAVTRHPSRVINVGIREQLMVGVAAGLALEGFLPLFHSYAPFLVERPYEQLKLDFGHQNVRGIAVSVGASFDASAAGRSHQAPEDVPLIATLPDWSVQVPGHPDEVESALRAAITSTESVYLRLAEQSNATAVEQSHRLRLIKKGSSPAPLVIAVGSLLDTVLEAVSDLPIAVAYTTQPYPFDTAGLLSVLEEPVIISVEPYQAGTVALAVEHALRSVPHRILPLGVRRREHRRYGTPEEHARFHGLDVRGIRARIKEFLAAS
jgi:transketolase